MKRTSTTAVSDQSITGTGTVAPANVTTQHNQKLVRLTGAKSDNPSTVESRARRAAQRFGYIIKKSRSRTESLDNFGGFMLIDPYIKGVVDGLRFDLSAEDIIELCTESAGTAGQETTTNGAQEGVALGAPKPVDRRSETGTVEVQVLR